MTDRHGGEVAPLVVGAEFRGAFVAQRCGDEVFAVPVVAHAAEERYELGIVLISAHAHFAFVLHIFAGADVVGMQTVVGGSRRYPPRSPRTASTGSCSPPWP